MSGRSLGGALRQIRFERRMGVAADLCVVAGIVIGLWTYFDQKSEADALRKREAALQFAALRHEAVNAEAAQALITALSKDGRYLIQLGNQKDAKQQDAQKIVDEVGLGRIDGLAKFYISAATCVETEVCDETIVRNVFEDDIRFFYCSTSENIFPIVQGSFHDPNIYDGLTAYFNKYVKSCPPGPTVASLSEKS
jgi:hypothetical protein